MGGNVRGCHVHAPSAGDLFHENHPSREAQLKVVRLLRKYCFREHAPSSLDFVSDPTINFQHSNFPAANYCDENLRVSMPIFTIHGNHDDLSGKVGLADPLAPSVPI